MAGVGLSAVALEGEFGIALTTVGIGVELEAGGLAMFDLTAGIMAGLCGSVGELGVVLGTGLAVVALAAGVVALVPGVSAGEISVMLGAGLVLIDLAAGVVAPGPGISAGKLSVGAGLVVVDPAAGVVAPGPGVSAGELGVSAGLAVVDLTPEIAVIAVAPEGAGSSFRCFFLRCDGGADEECERF